MIDFSKIKEGDKYKINVLGTEYTIIFSKNSDKYPGLVDSNGYEDCSDKTIIVVHKSDEDFIVKDFVYLIKKNLRHEILHAFFDESGLAFDSHKTTAWAVNEEMVDWFAMQSPKIYKVYQELGILD